MANQENSENGQEQVRQIDTFDENYQLQAPDQSKNESQAEEVDSRYVYNLGRYIAEIDSQSGTFILYNAETRIVLSSEEIYYLTMWLTNNHLSALFRLAYPEVINTPSFERKGVGLVKEKRVKTLWVPAQRFAAQHGFSRGSFRGYNQAVWQFGTNRVFTHS